MMKASLCSPLWKEACLSQQARGIKFTRHRTKNKEKSRNTSWAQSKEYHDILLMIVPRKLEVLPVERDKRGLVIGELYHLNKTKQGEYVLGKVTASTIDIFRVR